MLNPKTNKLLSILFILLLLINLSSCSVINNVKDKVTNVFESKEVEEDSIPKDNIIDYINIANEKYTNFALDLFKNVVEDCNANYCISPLAVYESLAKIGNDCQDYTKNNIETLLGMSIEDANEYMEYYFEHGNSFPSIDILNDKTSSICGSDWLEQFSDKQTYNSLFNCYDGTTKIIPMMKQTFIGRISSNNSPYVVAKRLSNGMNFIAILNMYDKEKFFNDLKPSVFNEYLSCIELAEFYETDDSGCSYSVNKTTLNFPEIEYEDCNDLSLYLDRKGITDMANYDFVVQNLKVSINEKSAIINEPTKGEYHLETAKDVCKVESNYEDNKYFNYPFIYAFMYQDIPVVMGYVGHLGGYEQTNAPVAVNIAGNINIREYPSTSADIVGTFRKNDRYLVSEIVYAEDYIWYKIGNDAWVASKNNEWIKLEYDK